MQKVHLQRAEDGLAILRLDDPEARVNTLSEAMVQELEAALDRLASDGTLRGLLIMSGKEDTFLAGADIKDFDRLMVPGAGRAVIDRAHALYDRIEALPYPVLAAIHGHCLGGGLELALACRFRIATDHPKSLLGLPEVRLGLIPAAGGTQRFPQVIGVRRALPLMLEGRTIHARQAKALGLIDYLVYPAGLLDSARRCLEFLSTHPAGRRAGMLDRALARFAPARRLFFDMAHRQILARTHGNYPAPLRLIDCVETGLAEGRAAGYAAEADAFDTLLLTPESYALRSLFFDTTALKKNPLQSASRPIARIGVLGSGLMGSGIATVSAEAGLPVVLKDVSWPRLTAGLKGVWSHMDRQARKRRRNPVERDQAYSRVLPTVDYDPMRQVGLVIEAVFEDLAVKQQVLREAEAILPDEAIFASNTSALPIREIAEASRRPEQVIGMHYFSPVPRMPLLEVVVSPKTAQWVTATAIALGQRQGKTVIVVNDSPGFYTSRILSPMLAEAIRLLEEGADIRRIDRAMERFGFPVGPFRLLDEVGIDVAAHASQGVQPALAGRGAAPSDALARLLASGQLGRKSGRGFYRYDLNWLERHRRTRPVNASVYGLFGGKRRREIDPAEITDRLVWAMVSEAVYCLQEEVIASARDGNVGAVLGLGFPPFLGGPFHYLDRLGLAKGLERLETLQARYGARFQPAELLRDMARRGEEFTQVRH